MTPEQGKEISKKIQASKDQYDRIVNRALEEAVPGTAPREIERLTLNLTNVHNDMIAALNTLKQLLP